MQRPKLLAGALVLGLLIFTALHFRDKVFPTRYDRAAAHRAVAMRKLGEHLARAYPQEQALVVGNPFTKQKGRPAEIYTFQKAELEGFAKGFGRKKIQVAFPKLREEVSRDPRPVQIPPGATTPLSYLVAADSWQELAATHPQCGLLVSVIGLPLGIEATPLWGNIRPRIGLLLPDFTVIGREEAERAVKSGKIAAFVANKPGAPNERSGESDWEKEFDRRFILVTAANLEEVRLQYPQLFSSTRP